MLIKYTHKNFSASNTLQDIQQSKSQLQWHGEHEANNKKKTQHKMTNKSPVQINITGNCIAKHKYP